MCRRGLICLVGLFFCLCGQRLAVGAVNGWTKPTSGYWEEQAYWSLGVLPDATQDIVFTNAGWKALAIGSGTVQTVPQSLHVASLRVGAPVDSYNTLLMNFSGFEQPLQTGSLIIESNGAVLMQSSALDSGYLGVGGRFSQSDFSQVKIHGALNVGWPNTGVYFLTNGTLTVEGNNSAAAESITGGFQGTGKFFQYGGSNRTRSIQVSINGEFNLYDGEVIATNGITVGIGDYADYASFNQFIGSVNADTVINGNYLLNGGQITGHMSVVSATDYQRVNAYVLQSGGTNSAVSLDLGHPNRFGGRAFYVLSNGVVSVASSTTFRGGEFSQYGGQHTIVSNLFLQGTDLGLSFGFAGADYFLWGGILSAGGLTIQASEFQQNGGTNSIAGDIVLSGPYPQGTPQAPRYFLEGGLLSASNLFVSAFFGGFQQTGGTNQISGRLTVTATNYGGFQYSLEGGTLVAKNIIVSSNAFFQHSNGTILHSGLLTLSQGGWRSAIGDHSLGPLVLTGGPATNSTIRFLDGTSILRLANSAMQPWDSSAVLYISNWHGSTSGHGDTQLFVGSNGNGLTSQQLAQIRFSLTGGLYPAQMLSTGEVIPATQLPPLAFSSNPDALILSWTGNYPLLSATNVSGPYDLIPGATSPFTNAFVDPQRFFRLGLAAP